LQSSFNSEQHELLFHGENQEERYAPTQSVDRRLDGPFNSPNDQNYLMYLCQMLCDGSDAARIMNDHQ
jgi:hypothetical protein